MVLASTLLSYGVGLVTSGCDWRLVVVLMVSSVSPRGVMMSLLVVKNGDEGSGL